MCYFSHYLVVCLHPSFNKVQSLNTIWIYLFQKITYYHLKNIFVKHWTKYPILNQSQSNKNMNYQITVQPNYRTTEFQDVIEWMSATFGKKVFQNTTGMVATFTGLESSRLLYGDISRNGCTVQCQTMYRNLRLQSGEKFD